MKTVSLLSRLAINQIKEIIMQTYAVVYQENGNFFMATKNYRGYFFHFDRGGGQIYTEGFPIKYGAGLSALPDGGLKSTDPAIGAANEFYEETKVELRDFVQELTPQAYQDERYYGVYFKFSADDFATICDRAINNIAAGVDAVAGIENGRIRNYEDITTYPNCPLDNELAHGAVWNIQADWERIEALNNEDTNWFYYILRNLRENL